MPLKTLVKVGRITNLSDARYCAGMGVDMLGFSVVEGQPHYISPKAFQEIRGWVTGPQIVAELHGIKSAADLETILEQYRPDLLALTTAELDIIVNSLLLPFILEVDDEESFHPSSLEPDYIEISNKTTHLEKFVPDYNILMRVESIESVNAALHQTGVTGVSLNGTDEIRPGLKNFDELATILEHLESE